MIDQGLIFDGFYFLTNGFRNHYIRTLVRERPEWLKKNPGVWRRLEDVLREEDDPPRSPVESEIDLGADPAGPSSQTSFGTLRDISVAEEDVALQDTLAADNAPPELTTSTLVSANVENEAMNAELLPMADTTTGEATAPKAEITAVGPTQSGLGRSGGGRQLKKQKLPAEISRQGKKRSPENLRLILDSLAEYPVKIDAAKKAGIHRRTLDYWLKCSAAGREGYVLEWQGVTAKFHEHFLSAIEEGVDNLKGVAHQRASGYDEVLTYQGRVVYKLDPQLVAIGCQGHEAYLRDENGNPVPETIRKQDPKMIRWLLERLRPGIYGNDRDLGDTQRGGVLVVGRGSNTQKLGNEFGDERQIPDVEFDVEDGPKD